MAERSVPGGQPQEPDAATAEGILEGAGYTKSSDGFYGKDGTAIELDLFSPDGWTDYNDAAKLISAQAAEAGIRVNARTVSEAEYWTPISTGDFQLALYGITQSLVADPYPTTTSTSPRPPAPRSARSPPRDRTTPATPTPSSTPR